LNVLTVTLPPLRERREDIPELAQHFLDLHAVQMKLPPKKLSGEALRILMRYHWPGNIRELENAMKGSLVLADREVLVPEVLPAAVLRGAEGGENSGSFDLDHVARWVVEHATFSAQHPLMGDLERAVARQMVDKVGEKTMAARLLGISKPTLYNRLKDVH
jgi:DNA-binding NtrC family response regulator